MHRIGYNKFNIKLLEEKKCNNKLQIQQLEQKWMDEYNPDLNMLRAYTPDDIKKIKKKEYRKKERKKINKKKKIYRKKNKKKISITNKIYYEKTKHLTVPSHKCVCGGYVSISHKSRHIKSKKHIIWLNHRSKLQICLINLQKKIINNIIKSYITIQ